MKNISPLLLLLCLTVATGTADAYGNKELLENARAGDIASMRSVAHKLYYGQGAPKDVKNAIKWWQKAVEAGDPVSCNLLGDLYRDGAGVHKNANKAYEYYKKADQFGSEKARARIAKLSPEHLKKLALELNETDASWNNANTHASAADKKVFLSAVKKGDEEAIKRMLKESPSLAFEPLNSSKETALMFCKSTKVAQVLLRAGANANYYTRLGDHHSPLLKALMENDKKLAKALVAAGADINNKNTNLLQVLGACKDQSPEQLLDGMLDCGLDAGQKHVAQDILALAIHKKVSKSLIERLVQAGAPVNAYCKIISSSPLCAAAKQACISTKKDEAYEILCYLLDHNADVDGAKEEKASPLAAVLQLPQNEKVVKKLVEKGANVNHISRPDDKGSCSVLKLAVQNKANQLPIIQYLVEHGANASWKDGSGKRPSHYAESSEIKDFLVSKEVKEVPKPSYTPDSGKSDEQKAKELILAAQQGDEVAQFSLSLIYYSLSKKDPQYLADSVAWLRKSAAQGFTPAQIALGEFYLDGTGVPKNETEAARLFRLAAEKGAVSAQDHLGACYMYGRGVPRSEVEAAKWFSKAAEKGYAQAQKDLGSCYYEGRGVPKNQVEAARWFRKAAEQDHAKAQVLLGVCYALGTGVPRDKQMAAFWFRKAAAQGDKDAIKMLRSL